MRVHRKRGLAFITVIFITYIAITYTSCIRLWLACHEQFRLVAALSHTSIKLVRPVLFAGRKFWGQAPSVYGDGRHGPSKGDVARKGIFYWSGWFWFDFLARGEYLWQFQIREIFGKIVQSHYPTSGYSGSTTLVFQQWIAGALSASYTNKRRKILGQSYRRHANKRRKILGLLYRLLSLNEERS